MESPNLEDYLTRCIVGQKRTGSSKQFVFLEGDYAIKGPYSEGRLNNVVSRSKILSELGPNVAVLMIDQFETKDGIFIRFPNLMKEYKLESEPHQESFSSYKYNILKNSPVINIGEALRNKKTWIFPLLEDSILTLCYCYILKTGDMNIRNFLSDPNTKQFYVIDYDDNLSTERDDEVFYFNKLPAKAYDWYNNVKCHYNKVANRLKELVNSNVIISNNLSDRLLKTINLLEKYGEVKKIVKLNIIKPASPKIIPKPILKLNVIKKEIPLPKKIVTDNNGYMNWKGPFGGSTTFSNIKLDIAKSALQKYIRRNIEDKALLIAFELYRFSEILEAKAAVSNLYNRLAIIANEDIGPANLSLVLEVTRLVESKDRNTGVLYQMVKLLSESKKSRFPSHCWRSYSNPDGRKVAEELGLPLDNSFTSDDLLFIEEHRNCNLFVESDPENIRCYLLTFWKRLIDKDFNAFTWCYFYLEATKDLNLESKRTKFIKGNQRCNTKKADILIWKVLSKFLDPECHDILVESYYNQSESRPFLQLAVVVALYGLKYEKIDIIADLNNDKHIDDMLNARYEMIKIDDFVIDKHTKDGRNAGMSVKDFVDDGAYVANEDMTYHNELLVKIYSTR